MRHLVEQMGIRDLVNPIFAFKYGSFCLSLLAVVFLGSTGVAKPSGGIQPGETSNISASQVPQQIQDVGIDQKIGNFLSPDLAFTDHLGRPVTLGQYLALGKPLIISPVYYSCPGLCNFHLNGLVDGLKGLDWLPGKSFHVLAVSFDSNETHQVAAKKRENYLSSYGRSEGDLGWHFLTGSQDQINQFTTAIGFKYKWDDKANEWAHASSAIIVSPQGQITRYLPGVYFEAKDIKLALNESVQGKLGTFADKLVLYCFKYDASKSAYTLYAFNIMKLAGALTVILLALWLIPFWIRGRLKPNLKTQVGQNG